MISIILPVYNSEKFLYKCINSILKQTYADFELIIINDGSTDRSIDIINEFANIDDRIVIINQANKGFALARNSGINKMIGDWVTFIDSDDIIENTHLEILINKIEETSSDIVFGGFQYLSYDGERLLNSYIMDNEIFFEDSIDIVRKRLIGSLPYKKDSLKKMVWGNIYCTKIIKENNIQFYDKAIYYSEDLIFNLSVTSYAKIICLVSSTGYKYRKNEESVTRKYNKKNLEYHVSMYNSLLKDYLPEFHDKAEVKGRIQRNFLVSIRELIIQTKSIDSVKIRNYEIGRICSNKTVKAVVSDYSKIINGIKQRVFCYLVKYEQSWLLDKLLNI